MIQCLADMSILSHSEASMVDGWGIVVTELRCCLPVLRHCNREETIMQSGPDRGRSDQIKGDRTHKREIVDQGLWTHHFTEKLVVTQLTLIT